MPMFVTHGPVPPDSGSFVGRAAELKLLETWLAHVNCVGAVLGARQTGKTSLLLKLRHLWQGKYAFVFVNLQAIDGAEVKECFTYIAEQMAEQLSDILDQGNIAVPQEAKTFPSFLREFSKKARAVRIIIILDEIGALRPETGMKLASTIRAVFTDRLVKPELARYMFLLAGATDMLELTTGRNSPLGNVTERIYLGDLSLSEIEQLLTQASGETSPPPLTEISRRLHMWTNGHPYWTQLLASTLEGRPSLPTEETIGEAVQHLLRTEDRNLPHVIRALRADSALWRLVESLLDGLPMLFSRSNSDIARLELIGILREQEGRCAIRNRIYKEAIHKHQIKPPRLWTANLRTLGEIILRAPDTASLLREIAGFTQQVFQSGNVVLFARARDDRSYRVFHAVGVTPSLCNNLEIECEGTMVRQLEAGIEPGKEDPSEFERIQLRNIASAILRPLKWQGSPRYFMSLGPKLSGEDYDAQDRNFLALVAERLGEGIERFAHLELGRDAVEAREVQRNLLPREIPQIPGMQIVAFWQPARNVGGDYYDVIRLSEHKLALCIADVAGKGMPAALLMSNLQAKVKTFASELMGPREVCAQLNRTTAADVTGGKFITFFYGMVDARTRRMAYTNAGHCPPVVMRADGTVTHLEAGGAVLGVFPDWKYGQTQIELLPGDRLVLFTDGVTEAQNPEEQDFGEDRLIELLRHHRELNAAQLQGKLIEAVASFSGGDFRDDVTFMIAAVE
jgi:hypothetical protein